MNSGRRRRCALLAGLALAAPIWAMPIAATGSGAATESTDPSASPKCFGAAARDPATPCQNPALRYAVRPSPDDAVLEPNSSCVLTGNKGPPNRVCSFGTEKGRARATVALLGDSHAPAWRAAVDVMARGQRWRGLTVRRSSCPFSTARRSVDPAAGDACLAWIDATRRWFGNHPEVQTVFVVVSAAYEFLPAGGQDAHATAVAGYRAALDSLPPTVRRIIVIRDNPLAQDDTLGCVADALARHRRADLRCALPRETALLRDPATEAAVQLPSRRGRVVDLSDRFCDKARCYPVVGGALVYKDKSHLTATFAATLGPALLRAVRALDATAPAPG